MKLRLVPILVLVCGLLAVGAPMARANPVVRMDYSLTLQDRSRGTIFIELFADREKTTENFLKYVDGGVYDNSLMHRLSRNFVLQGGGFYPFPVAEPHSNFALLPYSLDRDAEVDLDFDYSTANPAVVNEYNIPSSNPPTRSNLTGTLAMARRGGQPDSADSEWFINLANNSFLDGVDGGFTVFGHVIGDGMTLVNAYNGLDIKNLNPDIDNNGVRENGYPFGSTTSTTDGVPILGNNINNLLTVLNAERIDYLGAGLTSNVPAGGLTFGVLNAFIDTGMIFTGTGPLTIGAGKSLGIREGFGLNRSLINHGTLSPGLQLGAISVQSDYLQFADGTLDIQLRVVDSAIPDSQEFDALNVTGVAYLAGKLDISLLYGFQPTAGQSFTVLTAAGFAGNFNTIELPALNPGLVWAYNKSATSIMLTVAAADFNRNGVVDMADYALWRNTRNTSVATAYAGADANGDKFINDADFTIWRNNFGNTSGVSGGGGEALSAASVPEPSTSLLILLATIPLFGRGRRARK